MLVETFLDYYKQDKNNGVYDLSDKLTLFVMSFLFVAGAIVTFKFTINSPFVCFSPVNPSDFASNYVWTHGSIPISALNGTMPQNTAHWITLYKDSGIFYYQWIPLLFFLMFFVLYLSRRVWQRVSSTSASYNINSLLSDCNKVTHRNDKQVDNLARKLLLMITKNHRNSNLIGKVRHVIQRKLKFLSCSRSLGSSIFANYVIFKIVSIATCVALTLMINVIFHIDVSSLIRVWTTGTAGNNRFPRSVIAYVPYVIDLSGGNHDLVHCVITMNKINEKVFAILMPMFLVLALAHVISLGSWIVMIGSEVVRTKMVKRHLKRTNQNTDQEKIVVEFEEKYLQWDGVFIIAVMDSNCDPILVRRIVAKMWNIFLSEQQTEVLVHDSH